jgi:hypothetical protein
LLVLLISARNLHAASNARRAKEAATLRSQLEQMQEEQRRKDQELQVLHAENAKLLGGTSEEETFCMPSADAKKM